MSKWFAIVAGVLIGAIIGACPMNAAAQVTGPVFVFQAGTVINPDEVNSVLATIYDGALNRAGGTMTGNLLFSADNTLDIGASGVTRPRDLFLGRNAAIGGTLGVTGAVTLSNTLAVAGVSTLGAVSASTGTFSSTLGVTGATTLAALSATTGSFSSTLAATTLTLSNTGASALDVAGGINAGTGNVGIIGTDGRIPAISSTNFASLSGANLTGLLESAITDSTILARVAAAEIITGSWTFGTASVIGSIALNTPGGSNPGLIFQSAGVANGQLIQGSGGAFWDGPGTLSWRTVAGAARATLTDAGAFTASGGLVTSTSLAAPNTISPAALSTGNNNNYSPTGWADAFLVRLDGGAGSPVLTGLAAPSSGGTLKVLCRVAGNGVAVGNEDANSTAANRVLASGGGLTLLAVADGDCALVIYDSVSARWRNISVTQ